MKRTVVVTVCLVAAVGLMLTLPDAVTAMSGPKCIRELGKPSKPGRTTQCPSAEGIKTRKVCWRICKVFDIRKRCAAGARYCRYPVLTHFWCIRTRHGCARRYRYKVYTAPCRKNGYCYYRAWRCKCVLK